MARMYVDGKHYRYDLVKRWYSKLDLSNASTIYVPINKTRSHWILGIVKPQENSIEIYDSGKFISETRNLYAQKHGHALLLFMEDRAKSRSLDFEKLNWSIVEKERLQQLNYVDCGVFMSVYACFHSRNLPLDYNQEFVKDRRPEILLSIIDQKCHIELNSNNLNYQYPSHIIEDFTLTEDYLKPGPGIITIKSRCSELFGSKKRNKNTKKAKKKTEEASTTTSQAPTATTQKNKEISRKSLDPGLTAQVITHQKKKTNRGNLGEASSVTSPVATS
jgi:hypothetical protein